MRWSYAASSSRTSPLRRLSHRNRISPCRGLVANILECEGSASTMLLNMFWCMRLAPKRVIEGAPCGSTLRGYFFLAGDCWPESTSQTAICWGRLHSAATTGLCAHVGIKCHVGDRCETLSSAGRQASPNARRVHVLGQAPQGTCTWPLAPGYVPLGPPRQGTCTC